MTYITSPCITAPSRPTLFSAFTARLAVWRQRRALAALDSHALEDIGLTRAQANTEAQRSFWDAPETWYN